MKESTYNLLHFSVDDHINPYIPASRLDRLPRPISHFLGYRKTPHKEVPSLLQWFWSFLGAFIGILTVSAINKYSPGLQKYNPPLVVASLGASAILDYNAIHTPLAQPRNALFGQTFSAIIGVCVSKLFQLSPEFDELQFVAGALACACASLVMAATNTVHPPGGATAVLATTNAQVIAMGWIFIPFVMLGSVVMLAIALLVNNLQRQYPNYWWTSETLPARRQVEDLEKVDTRDSQRTLRHDDDQDAADVALEGRIVVDTDKVLIPDGVRLTDKELDLLGELQKRLRQRDGEDKDSLSASSGRTK